LTQAKGMLGLLRSDGVGPEIDVQPSLADLDMLAESIRSTGLTLDVRVEGHVRPLPKSVDVSAYRIVQESLTNVLKHAQARRAQVAVRYGVESLELQITDDGRGAPAAPEGTSYGLLGMRERAMILGGSMTAGSVEGGGFEVHVRLPMSDSAR
jgi:signal transduction histidine kinase